MHTLSYHLLDHMAEDLQKLGTLAVFNINQYEHLSVQNNQTCTRISQRIQTQLMENVIAIEKGYKGTLVFGKEDGGEYFQESCSLDKVSYKIKDVAASSKSSTSISFTHFCVVHL